MNKEVDMMKHIFNRHKNKECPCWRDKDEEINRPCYVAMGYVQCYEKAQALENVLRKIVNYPKGREIVAHFWDSIDNGKLALEEWERAK